jgi:Uri superfamily endonuclease
MDSRPGTYALILSALRPFSILIGRLGRLSGGCGFYVYVGSAFGPGGLLARVTRHCREVKPLHWHIDYLRQAVSLVETWYTTDALSREHAWARVFLDMPGAAVPAPGFGASDCRCRAHLFYLGTAPDFETYRRGLESVSAVKLEVQNYYINRGIYQR